MHAKLLQFEALHQLSTESEHAQTARALQVPDISQIPRGTIARGEEPLETRLEVLCFLVEEALTCDPTRKQLDNILEEQTDVSSLPSDSKANSPGHSSVESFTQILGSVLSAGWDFGR